MHQPIQPSPEELNQLFVKACEDHQNGLLDSAQSGYLHLLGYFSEAPLLHYNLGLVYYEQGDYEKSRNSFVRAAKLSPEDMDILFNLGLTQKKTGDLDGAIISYKRILEVDPTSIDTLYNLAGCYKDLRQHEKSIETYLEVLRLSPDHPSANNNLAYVYHLTGESERAVFYYKQVLQYKPDHQAAKHMLAALTHSDTTSSPESYVREVFDNYSPHYEQSLVVELEYCVPTTIRGLLDKGTKWKKTYEHGLDLGCGTGLSGEAFKDMVDVLDGIDLSQKMIDLAAAKKVYRKLYADNIVNFLKSSKESYDFYLAADVFAYVGDLAEMFSLLRENARQDVLFCFSSETDEGKGYRLQQTGRFAHAPAYIQEVAQAAGWNVVGSHKSSLRKEKDSWVQGDLWFLRLPQSV
ncbi:MAG: tetratricopeptide repeat protein [Desulfobulbaceae bacterium]|nr:tetratricopeptide repeat protein [Desulfobulbaceae bacterium]